MVKGWEGFVGGTRFNSQCGQKNLPINKKKKRIYMIMLSERGRKKSKSI